MKYSVDFTPEFLGQKVIILVLRNGTQSWPSNLLRLTVYQEISKGEVSSDILMTFCYHQTDS